MLEVEEKHKKKIKEVIQWLDLNRCFVITNNDSRIVFTINGKPCMIFIKSTDRPVSRQLILELQNYRQYGIKAEAIYNIYEMDRLFG